MDEEASRALTESEERGRQSLMRPSIDHEEIVRLLVEAVPDLIAVYRFGSEVSAQARPTSDVDLAILACHPLPSVRRFELEQELAGVLRRDVDLVDLRVATTVMRMQVISTGECLYSGDDSERQRFEAYVYSSYVRLNEERREILKDARERGLVYGR